MLQLFEDEVLAKSKKFLELCLNKDIKIVTAESCTGGLLAGLFTETPGVSHTFERGFVTYSVDAKVEVLNISREEIDLYGPVSSPVAVSMAKGAIKHSKADLSIAITGLAGPSGGTADQPIGLIYIACFYQNIDRIEKHIFKGDRTEIRMQALDKAIDMANGMI